MLSLALDGHGPLHRQTYRALRDAILSGRLRGGERLDSTRALARDLGVSRNTVLEAYDQLVAEGYATARAGAGTFVADALPRRTVPRDGRAAATRPPRRPAPPRLSDYGQRLEESLPPQRHSWSLPRERVMIDFRYGEPSYSDLPLGTWARLLGRRARRLSVKRLAYQPPGGAVELREALAGYLARARGVVASPERILITQGSQQAIDLTTRILIDAGDAAVLEEPHYTGYSLCLAALGAKLHHVPVDEHGLRTAELASIHTARLACVTPSHQFPSGGVLSLPRRLELLAWASRTGAYLLEDDYDGEFRFEGRPIECLQALDREERVIYLGTASKALFPALRIGWLVAPESIAAHLRTAKAFADTGTATLEQLALADFITEGHLERWIRRARMRHAARRRALIEALDRELGERVQVRGVAAGLHVLLRLPEIAARDVPHLRAACRERGVGVYPAAPFYARPPARAELLLGYAALGERAIRDGIRRLHQAVDATLAR